LISCVFSFPYLVSRFSWGSTNFPAHQNFSTGIYAFGVPFGSLPFLGSFCCPGFLWFPRDHGFLDPRSVFAWISPPLCTSCNEVFSLTVPFPHPPFRLNSPLGRLTQVRSLVPLDFPFRAGGFPSQLLVMWFPHHSVALFYFCFFVAFFNSWFLSPLSYFLTAYSQPLSKITCFIF